MLHEINGLPAHVLLIHAVVVLAPIGALFTVLSAVWPTARRRIGVYGPITCLVVLVLVPITTNAGEWLEDKLTDGQPDSAPFVKKIEKHADLGDTFLWFAIGLFVLSTAVWWIGRTTDRAANGSGTVTAVDGGGGGIGTKVRTGTGTATTAAVPVAVQYVVAALAVLMSIAIVVQLVRIGDSGAQAVWGT